MKRRESKNGKEIKSKGKGKEESASVGHVPGGKGEEGNASTQIVHEVQ
jgi:hypothetical protein